MKQGFFNLIADSHLDESIVSSRTEQTTILAFNDCSKSNNIDGIKMENAITYYSLCGVEGKKRKEKKKNALASDAGNDNV